jgi:hypothetical protein
LLVGLLTAVSAVDFNGLMVKLANPVAGRCSSGVAWGAIAGVS